MSKDDEIRDVMRKDRQRGRPQQIDFERLRERRISEERLVRAIQQGDKEAVLKALQALGYGKDSEEYRRAISLLDDQGLP